MEKLQKTSSIFQDMQKSKMETFEEMQKLKIDFDIVILKIIIVFLQGLKEDGEV